YVASGVFTGLTAGTYTWRVRDANGCFKTGTVTITIPVDITASAVANNPLCFGTANTGFTLTATGGTGTLMYSSNNGSTYVASGVFTGLTAGTYTWRVKDANGCEKTGTVTIAIPVDITASAAANNPLCFGTANTGFTITATGGTGTRMFSSDNGATYVASGVFTGLTAGTYTWRVRDANGCMKTGTVTITIPVDITASAVANNPLCFGTANTGFTITATGGTGTRMFSSDNGATYVASGVFTGLTAGTYTWRVRDANGCMKTGTVTITIPVDITASAVANNPLCFGTANTGFTITATGGTGTMMFSSDNGATYVASGVFTGLTAGTYTWRVRDANGCMKTGTVTITIPVDITASAVANNPLCFGTANTGFTITATGGTGTMMFSSDNGATYVASGVFTGLTAGTYTWRVRDANGCMKTGTVTITIPVDITASAVANNPLCFGTANTGFTITATGGTGTMMFSSDNGATYVASGVFTGLTAGTYTWRVRDANGCMKTGTVTITIPVDITASAVANNPLCFGAANTGFTITATGGTGTMMFSSDNGATYVASGVFTGLTAGTYTWRVRDANGCFKTGTVTITIPVDITASAVANNPLCFGTANTGFTITATGGTGTRMFSSDNGATYVASGVFTGLTAGTYTWRVRDANGCFKTGTVTITIPVDITASAVANNPLCFGTANTGFTITATGGTGTRMFSSDNGATYVASGVFTGLTAGTYTWRVRDANGCFKTGTVTITIPVDITASAVANNPLCFGTANTGFTITATGGTGTMMFSSDNGATYVASGVFTGLTAGTYTWRVRDANGCMKTGTVTITIPVDITASAVANNPLCFGTANTGFTITATGGTGTRMFSSDNGATYVASGVFTGLTAGTYTWRVRDANGCMKTGTVTITIPVDITASAVANNPLCFGAANTGFTITATGGTGTMMFSSDNGATYVASGVFTGLTAGTYTWRVRDANGCMKTGTVTITIPVDITASAVANNPLCFGAANTGFTITATGGTGTRMFSSDNGATYVASGVFTGLTAGTYTWRVRDANGCIKTGTVTITIPVDITASAVANNPLCFGTANTGFTITATG
ncbi:hypothetical protein ACNQGJ_16765, partial [Flavobacterium sp. GT2P42]